MKLYFVEFVFDTFKISQMSKRVFFLRSIFVIEDFINSPSWTLKVIFWIFLGRGLVVSLAFWEKKNIYEAKSKVGPG